MLGLWFTGPIETQHQGHLNWLSCRPAKMLMVARKHNAICVLAEGPQEKLLHITDIVTSCLPAAALYRMHIKETMGAVWSYRCSVVERRAQHDLRRNQKRLHLVQGYLSALKTLDEVVATIRAASDGAEAGAQLQSSFGLSEEQAEGVLNLSLRRLTSLEAQRLEQERDELSARYSMPGPVQA